MKWITVAALGSLLPATTVLAQDANPFAAMMEPPSDTHLYMTRILTLAVAAGIGYGFGAFWSPLFRPFRRVIWLGLAALAIAFTLFGPYPTADGFSYFLAFILFFIAFGFGVALGRKAVSARSSGWRRPTSFGSAYWATYEYLVEKGMFGRDGFMLGEYDFRRAGQEEPLYYKGVRHLLTVAPTRSGKGVSSIIPNLLQYKGSSFIIDPKGENALITAIRRGTGNRNMGIEGLGQKVMLLDPWDIAASKLGMPIARFNPLDWIKLGDPDAAENALSLADALVVPEDGKGDDRFWDEEAKALLTGIILYVATAPAETEHRTLGRVRDILTLGYSELHEVLNKMYNHPNPVVSSTAARQSSKEDKLFSAVMASAQAHTHFLDSPRIRQSLSQSDFRFEDLKTTAMSIYLILPADRLHTFRRWLRLLIQQAITVNARNIEARPERPILFMLDEMASLGKLPALEQAFSLMAGFGMQLWGIVQDLSQLARIYGEHGWQTFISNSGVIQYFGSRDKMTAEYFSSLCGVTTIEVHNISWAFGKALSFASSITSAVGGGSSSHTNTTSDSWTRTTGTSEAQRQLAYPDELMVLRENGQIIFVENLDPIPAKKITWYEDPGLKSLGVDLHKSHPALPTTSKTLAAASKLPPQAPSVTAPALHVALPEDAQPRANDRDLNEFFDDVRGFWDEDPPSFVAATENPENASPATDPKPQSSISPAGTTQSSIHPDVKVVYRVVDSDKHYRFVDSDKASASVTTNQPPSGPSKTRQPFGKPPLNTDKLNNIGFTDPVSALGPWRK